MKAITATMIIAALAGCSSKPACQDDIEAFVIAQDFVKRTLRSPSTANFPMITEDGVSSSPAKLADGRCAFNVRLFVDAENAFGGTVRQNFIVQVAPDGETGNWSLVDIEPL